MCERIAAAFLVVTLGLSSAGSLQANPSFQQVGNTLVMSNGNVGLNYNLSVGSVDFYWNGARKLAGFYSGVSLSSGYIKGTNYSSWSYVVTGSNQAVVTATGSGLPVMKQYFTLDQPDSFLIRVDIVGANLSVNWIGPVVVDGTGGVDLGVANDNRALVVPFDNDHFVRYNAGTINRSDTSFEVGAFYDNVSRNGLVVGSVTHDTWKSGVYFSGANNKLNQMNVFGGATFSSDVMPHGSVTGSLVSSPTMFVGFGSDWRVTMQNYAAENTNFVPRLPWTNGVPFGWNSWGVIQQNINYSDAITVADYFHSGLQPAGFQDSGTVYINLDAFWDNLSSSQLQSFVNHCHALGQKAGIYFGPFVWFGTASSAPTNFVEGTTNTYHYSDVLLRDGNGNPESTDGGLAVDPTHPGIRDRTDYYINMFTNYGFDYVKLDFLSHGALEGTHFDKSVTTGIEAYNQGMQYVLDRINGRMFVSESIAPLFPYQYAHSRRIACDAQTSLIGDTEYTMNSVSYGWWLDNLYNFNDPDIMVFGHGADTNENQSRLISGAVTGLFLDGDDLTTTAGQTAAQTCLGKQSINALARAARTFSPVEANTGTAAEDTFVRQDGTNWWIAVFNYNTNLSENKSVDLNRAGLPQGNFIATNLWDNSTTIVSNTFNVPLNAKQAKLFQLSARPSASLRWTGNNSGVWDTGSSINWFDQSINQPSAFYLGDQVLFDDSIGVPAFVSVNGTVMPGGITVQSSTNNFTFAGSGAIAGNGGIIKSGNSTLILDVSGGLTGPVTLLGGTIVTASSTLASVSSIIISDGGALDFDGTYLTGGKPLLVTGSGTGNGVLCNSGSEIYGNVLNLTLAGNSTFGGSSRWDLVNGSAISGAYELKISRANSTVYGEWDTVNLAGNVGEIELAVGKLGLKGMGATFGNPNATLVVDPNCELDIWNSLTGTNNGYSKNIHVQSNGTAQVLTSPNTFINANITLEDGGNWNGIFGSGTQTMNGTFTLNGIAHFTIRDSDMVFGNVISGPGGFFRDGVDHKMIFAVSNIYIGPTVIGDGLVLALTGSGSISQSSLVFFGGSNAAAIHLDASTRADKTFTLASGQTLSGIGGIAGNLIVMPGAALAPAGTNVTLGVTTGSYAVGTISTTNNVTLGGATVIKLDGNGTNDVIQAGGNITFGGTLNLANISGVPLSAGNSFQVFNANNYSSMFAAITPPTPGPGLIWDTTHLNAGKIGIVSAPTPLMSSVFVSGTNLIFGGTNGAPGGNYAVLTTTNIATPLASWTILLTNMFDTNGAFHVTNSMDPAVPQLFYRIKTL